MNCVAARQAVSQVVAAHDMPQIDPLRLLAEDARESARQRVRPPPVEVATRVACVAVAPDDLAARQHDQQRRNASGVRRCDGRVERCTLELAGMLGAEPVVDLAFHPLGLRSLR
jgi:hypothetical protein